VGNKTYSLGCDLEMFEVNIFLKIGQLVQEKRRGEAQAFWKSK